MSSEELVAGGEPRRVRSSKKLWLGVAAVTVLLTTMGLAAALYAWHYNPLVPGGIADPGPAQVELGLAGQRDTYRLPWAPHEPQYLDFSVKNNGRWAITVDGVRANSRDVFFGIDDAVAFEVTGSDELGAEIELPYRLEPGKELAFDVGYLVTTCGQNPSRAGFSRASISSLPVRWHALGVGHVTDVPIPVVLVETPVNVPQDFERACV